MAAAACIALAAVAGCDSEPSLVDPVPTVTVNPIAARLGVGDTLSLVATVTGFGSRERVAHRWEVADTLVASLASAGPPDRVVLRARRAGDTFVRLEVAVSPSRVPQYFTVPVRVDPRP